MTKNDPDSKTDATDELTARILKAVENVECCCGYGCHDRTGNVKAETVTEREDETP